MKEKFLKLILISILEIIMLVIPQISYADVGSFEDYDSGLDFDFDFGSSYDSGSDYTYHSSSDGGGLGTITGLFATVTTLTPIVLIIFIAMVLSKKSKNNNSTNIYNNLKNMTIYEDRLVVTKIKQVDPNFNEEEFQRFAKDVFVKLQNAWTDRDWEKIRPFEAEELFEQHKAQLEGYIRNNQINVMERICVNWVHLLSFEQYGGKDILKIDLNSRMGDYIIDATTKKVIRGDKTKEYYHTYTLTFIRTTGQTTVLGQDGLKTTNCPNCGAPTTITSSGRCEYCNSVITTEDHGWVLSNLTRKN